MHNTLWAEEQNLSLQSGLLPWASCVPLLHPVDLSVNTQPCSLFTNTDHRAFNSTTIADPLPKLSFLGGIVCVACVCAEDDLARNPQLHEQLLSAPMVMWPALQQPLFPLFAQLPGQAGERLFQSSLLIGRLYTASQDI